MKPPVVLLVLVNLIEEEGYKKRICVIGFHLLAITITGTGTETEWDRE